MSKGEKETMHLHILRGLLQIWATVFVHRRVWHGAVRAIWRVTSRVSEELVFARRPESQKPSFKSQRLLVRVGLAAVAFWTMVGFARGDWAWEKAKRLRSRHAFPGLLQTTHLGLTLVVLLLTFIQQDDMRWLRVP
jgi:hypothetical protein